MDTAQWPQGNTGLVKPIDENSIRPAATTTQAKPRPPTKEQPVNCPRCNSTNTKFCYYNNYSLSQPRYFCKTCRRYWTAGGSLRNVPVGGGSRKNKRSSSSALSSASAKKVLPDLNPPGQDLNLAYNPSQFNGFVHLPFGHEMKVHHHNPQNPNEPMGSRGFSSFMSSIPVSESGSIYSSGLSFPVHDQFKSSLSFSLDGISDHGYNGNLQGVQEHNANSSRISFPFEELKPVSTNEFDHQQDRGHGETNGYWNGLLTGGGGSW